MGVVSSDVLIELPSHVGRVTAVRSTLIQSSLNTLRKRGYFERYLQLIDPRHRAALLETLAPEWLAMEVAHAHYTACDALALSTTELHEVGEDVGERIQGTFIGTLVRKARTVGLTPWALLGQFDRLWGRVMTGGAVGLTRYFRAAFCGVIASGIKLGAGRAVTVRVSSAARFGERCLFKCAWV
jgi:hypothetical protein